MSKAFPLAAVVALIATPATAAPITSSAIDGEFLSISVSGADIDLASTGGQNKMRGRVRSAVLKVCRVAMPQGSTRVFEPFTMNECARDTRQAAEPQLTALFARAVRGEKIAGLDLKLARAAR